MSQYNEHLKGNSRQASLSELICQVLLSHIWMRCTNQHLFMLSWYYHGHLFFRIWQVTFSDAFHTSPKMFCSIWISSLVATHLMAVMASWAYIESKLYRCFSINVVSWQTTLSERDWWSQFPAEAFWVKWQLWIVCPMSRCVWSIIICDLYAPVGVSFSITVSTSLYDCWWLNSPFWLCTSFPSHPFSCSRTLFHLDRGSINMIK